MIDPVGLAPLFVALTQGVEARARRSIALRACGMAMLLLILFALFGEAVLGFIGISMPAFRVAGGILLFLTALDMLFERRTKRRPAHRQAALHVETQGGEFKPTDFISREVEVGELNSVSRVENSLRKIDASSRLR